jgi:hypothetical protein
MMDLNALLTRQLKQSITYSLTFPTDAGSFPVKTKAAVIIPAAYYYVTHD